MYAAVLHEYGAPRFDRFHEPQLTGNAVVVNVTAAALSQFDVVHASGQHVIRPQVLPAVAGNEGIGRLQNGRRARRRRQLRERPLAVGPTCSPR